jgi:hypothetical protein
MNRAFTCSTTALALGACVFFLSAAPGCGKTSAPGFVGDDGGGGDARADAAAASSGGAGGAHDGAAGAGGAAGTGGGGGAGGAAGTNGADADGGTAGAGGAGGAPANPDAARPDGAPGAGGATADASAADAATLVCRQAEACAAGQECQTACAGAAANAATTTFCTCAPADGNRMTLACVDIPCNRDAGADVRPAIAACPNGIRNQDDCNSGNDTICATPCTNQMQMRCVCAPRGGGGGARWMCGAATACTP